MSYTYDWPMAALTVDNIVCATTEDGKNYLLLIKRKGEPYKGKWALPGGFYNVGKDKSFEDAARRELKEETGLEIPGQFWQVAIGDKPGRDPRGEVVSIVFASLIEVKDFIDLPEVVGEDDAELAVWVENNPDALEDLLAFDHFHLITEGLTKAAALEIGFEVLLEELDNESGEEDD